MTIRGRSFRARAFGHDRPDGTWTAWLEFEPDDTPGRRYSTDEETSQPNLVAIEYWTGGLEPVYLEGALGRALDREPVVDGQRSGAGF